MQRREFLSGALHTAGATGLLTTPSGRALGANDRVIVGLIGCGGRGRYVAGLMREAPGVEFAAAADVYLPNAERARWRKQALAWLQADLAACLRVDGR